MGHLDSALQCGPLDGGSAAQVGTNKVTKGLYDENFDSSFDLAIHVNASS